MGGNIFFLEFEPVLLKWLQSIFGSIGEYIGLIFGLFGELVVVIGILGFIYWCYDKEMGKQIGVGVAVAACWNPLLKNIVLRIRPYMVHEEVQCLRPVEPSADIYDISAQGYSFPSGHSTNSAAIYGSFPLVLRQKIFKVCAVVIPLLVGLSRMIVGVHYPTDVLVGWLLGYGVVYGVWFLQKKIKHRWILHLILFLISAVGIFYCKTEDYYSTIGVLGGLFLAIPFEEKFVNFSKTRNVWFCILRLAGGGLGFFLLDVLLKLPFSNEFLHSPTFGAYMVRALRYFIIVFVLIGAYPKLFAPVENWLTSVFKRK